MKYKNIILIALILFFSCAKPTEESRGRAGEPQELVSSKQTKKEEEGLKSYKVVEQTPSSPCENYWQDRFPNDSLKALYIDTVISQNQLSENNILFLNALKKQPNQDLAFKNVLSPIFRLSETEIGILTFSRYKFIDNKFIPDSKELELIESFDTTTANVMDHFGKIRYYPALLDSLYKGQAKPFINYYAINKTGEIQVMQLGEYIDECLEYFTYAFDTTKISIEDKLLFSSPYKIDLTFENNPAVDLLLQNDYKEECLDCPTSMKLQKTFARVKGTNNLYFLYADTFPINKELDTPSRALILINEKEEIKYLWYSEIDLFGCSCL